MKGLLIYSNKDIKHNRGYISWLITEAYEQGINLDFISKESYLSKGIKNDCDFVINRSRSYEISLIFELNGIRVFNNSNITLLGNNKLSAYRYAHELGIPYPKVLLDWDEKHKIISKPNDSHGGEGIGYLQDINLSDREYRIQQEFISELVGDVRFYIIGNELKYSVIRNSRDKLVSNYSLGGSFELYTPPTELLDLLYKLISDLDIDYAGVDFLVTKDNQYYFNEIEDVVGSRMLSKLDINDTTKKYIEHIRKTL